MKIEQTPSCIGEVLATGSSIRMRGAPEHPAVHEESAPSAISDGTRRKLWVLLGT
jgi:hypothetical protein